MTRTVALNSIYELAKIDKRVVFVGSDLAPNTLSQFKQDFPDRYFMMGVQEQSTMGMAAGLAMEGFIPFVNNIAVFATRRSYEQAVLDVALHNLPVRILGNGGGLVYSPLGPSHMAIDDLAIMRAIPNMQVICCSDNEEMMRFMPSTLEHKGPMYIRLGKDSDPIFQPQAMYNNDAKIMAIGTGIMSQKLKDAMDIAGIPYCIENFSQIKPLPRIIHPSSVTMIVTAEEGVLNGGLGSAVLERLADNNIQVPVLRFGLPDAFPHHYGEQADLMETYGLTPEKMAGRIKEFYEGL